MRIIKTTFLFDFLGYVFSDISSEAFFLSEINNVQSKTIREANGLPEKVPAGSVSSCETA